MPLPLPLVGCALQIHDAPLSACHAQPAGAWTLTVPVPPAAANDATVVESVTTQGPPTVGPVPACVIVKTLPPMVIVPVRAAPVFGMTV